MTDLASLAIEVDATKADAASGKLDNLAASGGRAEIGVKKIATAMDQVQAALNAAIGALDRNTASNLKLEAANDRAATAMAQAAAAAKVAAGGITQEAVAVEQAARATVELATTTTKLTINFTQSAAAAAQLGAAVQQQATASGQAATAAQASASALSAQASAAQQAAVELQQLDAHVQAYQAHLAAMPKAAAPFDAHVQSYRKNLDEVQKSLKFTAVEGLNASRQLADVFVTAASGMSPFMIALQQGPQLFDILQNKAVMTGQTIGTVFKAAGTAIYTAIAPILPLIGLVAAAAAGIAAVFAIGAKQINDDNKNIVAGLGLTEKQLERVKKAGVDTSVTMGDTFAAFFDVIGEDIAKKFEGPLKWLGDAWNDTIDWISKAFIDGVKLIAGAQNGLAQGIVASWKLLPGAIADVMIQIVNLVLKAVQDQINGVIAGINAVLNFSNEKLGTAFENFGNVDLGQVTNSFAGKGADFAKAFMEGFNKGMSETAAGLDKFLDDVAKKAVARREKAIRDAAGPAEKAAKGPKTDAEKFGDLVGDVTRDIAMVEARTKALSLSADEAARLTNEQELLNKAQAAGITLTDKQRGVLMGLAGELTAAQIAFRKATNLKTVNEDYEQRIRALGQAADRVGVYGQALNELTIYQNMLNKATNGGKDSIDALTDAQLRGKAASEALKQANLDRAEYLAKINKAHDESIADLEREAAELGLTGAALETYRRETELLNEARAAGHDKDPVIIADIKRQAAEFGALANQIANAAENLAALNGAMSNVGGPLGQIMGVLTSNNPTAALLGMGGVGSLVGMLTPGGTEALGKQRDMMQVALERVLGPKSSNIASGIADIFQGAGIGSQVAGIIGNGSTGANLGGMAGGALGNHLGGQISAFGGVLGSIAGSVLGTVIGGLFKKTPTGSVMISNGGTVGTSGNGGRASEASSFGGAVLDSLNKIASALGVSNTGSIKLSVGMRGENYVVDPLGLGRTKESDVLNFGKDSAAALEAAVRLAIEKGALEGLTEGTKKFLLEGDLQTQINRYNDYKSALTEYSQIKDPQRFETQALENQRGEIIQTAQQLGASLDDMAKLEELFQIKRNEIIEKYTTEAAEIEQEAYRTRRALEIQIMELEGNATGALAAARELEKSQVDASLIPLYDRIYALQDEKAVTDAATQAAQEAAAAAKAIADERYGLETRILELQGNTAALRERELAAIDPANRALKEYIYTLEDSAAAAANAAAILSQQGQIAITRSGGGGGGGAAANGYVSDSELDAAIAGAALGIDKATGALGPFLSRIIVRESSSTRRAITDAQRIAYVAGFDPSLQADASNAFDRQLQRGYYDEAAAADRGSAGGGETANGNGPGDPAVLAKWLQDIWKYAALGAAGKTGISDAANDNLGRSVKEVTDRFRSLSEELTKFRDSLFATEFAPERSFGALRAQYNQTAMLAQTGDETALAGLPQIARQYLDIAKTRASSRADYEAIVSGVIDNVNGGIGAATAVVDRNQAMLDAQTRTADGIDALRQEVKGLREDNKNLQKTVAAGNADQRKTANALNDASRGGVLKVELAA